MNRAHLKLLSRFPTLGCFAPLVALLLLGACAPKLTTVNGSVFVVTKGSDNVKLALVNIHFYDEATAARLANMLIEKAKVETEDVQAEFDKHETIAANAYVKMKSAEAELSMARQRAQDADTVLQRMSPSRPVDVPDYLISKWDSLKTQRDERVIERDAAEDRFRAKRVESERATHEYSRKKKMLLDQITAGPTSVLDAFFEVVPAESVATAKSDADGKFSLSLPRKGRYAIAATARREVAGKTERYYWFVWVPSVPNTALSVILSNDNQINGVSSDSVVSLADLLPVAQ